MEINERIKLEQDLSSIHERNVLGERLTKRNCIEAGGILEELLTNPPEGLTTNSYKSQLIDKCRISARTIQQYRVAFRQARNLPKPVLEELKKSGLNLNDTQTLKHVIETTAFTSDPREIAQRTKEWVEQTDTKPRPRTDEILQGVLFRKVCEFFEKGSRKTRFADFVQRAADYLKLGITISS